MGVIDTIKKTVDALTIGKTATIHIRFNDGTFTDIEHVDFKWITDLQLRLNSNDVLLWRFKNKDIILNMSNIEMITIDKS